MKNIKEKVLKEEDIKKISIDILDRMKGNAGDKFSIIGFEKAIKEALGIGINKGYNYGFDVGFAAGEQEGKIESIVEVGKVIDEVDNKQTGQIAEYILLLEKTDLLKSNKKEIIAWLTQNMRFKHELKQKLGI